MIYRKTPMLKPRRATKLVKPATSMTLEVYIGQYRAFPIRFPGTILPLSVVYELDYGDLRLISWRMPTAPERIVNESAVWRAVHHKAPGESFFEAIQLEGSTYMATHSISEFPNGYLEWKKLVSLESILFRGIQDYRVVCDTSPGNHGGLI